MKAPTNRRFLLVICVLFLLSAACAFPGATQQTPDVVQTLAAQTIAAMQTQVSGSSITATPGIPSSGATNPTSQPQPTATLLPSSTPLPTATQVILPSATPTQVCDQAAFMSDVTVADGTTIPAGTQFVKTWRLRNEGVCTWTPDYAIVFDSGDSMSGPASQKLGASVIPGQTIDISVTLRAPGSPGNYRGNWKMRNAAGVLFGLGNSSTGRFYVIIKVVTPTSSANGYDFAANVCLAEWTGNGKAIPCTGSDGSADGFVLYRSAPKLETGYQDDEPALVTNPPSASDSAIRGKYPAYTVKSKDHFITLIGCEYNAKDCYVRYQLDYQVVGESNIQTFAAWTEKYDNAFSQIDIDLSSLAGKNVNFILTVTAAGESKGDRAQWLLPRIQNVP